MADLSDVENALVAAILAAAENGPGQFPLIGGNFVRVYRGTPPVAGLSVDRSTGLSDICVFSAPDATRNTTRWGVQSALLAIAAGLSATVSGQSATFAGSAVAGELAGLLVNDQPFVYQAQAGDSAALVAAALADLVRATEIVWVTGATLTIPAAVTLVARTAGVATVVQEWARQEQVFRLSVWSPSPGVRDMVCAALGAALAQVTFLTLADGTAARLRYDKTASFDADQVASIYQRDLLYAVEYATTVTTQSPVMLFGDSDYNTVPTFV